jgi:hypothetical protein
MAAKYVLEGDLIRKFLLQGCKIIYKKITTKW